MKRVIWKGLMGLKSYEDLRKHEKQRGEKDS